MIVGASCFEFHRPPRTWTWKIKTLIAAFIGVGDATRFREERFAIVLRLFMLPKYLEKAPALLFSQGWLPRIEAVCSTTLMESGPPQLSTGAHGAA